MASVNGSRNAQSRAMSDATNHARMIAFNDDGEACVWHGGYTFNVYDAARDWREIRAFSSGQMAGLSDYDTPEARGYAKERMKSEGFKIVE